MKWHFFIGGFVYLYKLRYNQKLLTYRTKGGANIKRPISSINHFYGNIKKIRKGLHKKTKLITVSEWITYWYKTYKEPKHAITTRPVQWTYINHHIIPNLGNKFMHKVETPDIQEFLNMLSTSGNKTKLKNSKLSGTALSAWTVKKIRALLVATFDVAIREGYIQNNPVRETEHIPVQTLRCAFFSPEQQDKFLKGTKNHRFHVAYQLLFNTGCRRSEILGLSWDCVNFKLCQIQIEKVLVNIDGKPVLKNYPKTKSSIRTIPLHPMIMKLLKEHKRKQAKEINNNPDWYNEYNLVFVNKDGSPHSPTYFLHNFKNAIKKLKLPKSLRVHSTRHTFATNLLQLGVPISDVQSLGGWADTRVVLDIYAHAAPDSHRRAIKKLYEKRSH